MVTAAAVRQTTVRLPVELDERLSAYFDASGAVRNRVIALALRSYLGDPTRAGAAGRPQVRPRAGAGTVTELAAAATGHGPGCGCTRCAGLPAG